MKSEIIQDTMRLWQAEPENVKKLNQAWREHCPIFLALVDPTPVDISLGINPQ